MIEWGWCLRRMLGLAGVLAVLAGCESTIERLATDGGQDGAAGEDGALPGDDGGGPALDGAIDGQAEGDGGSADGGAAPDPFAVNRALGRGVNMGNFLEAPNEGDWSPGGRRIQQGDFPILKAAGFDSVRIPVKWSGHALADPPYTIDAAFMARVQEVVDWALAPQLAVVLNIHHYDEIHADPVGHGPRFVALWTQIATAFKNRPLDRVVFELLNEPTLDIEASEWNALLRDGIAAIRAIDPSRTIMVGPRGWNAAWALEELDLPSEERNLIVTIHMYEPFWFTHSGATWVTPTPAPGAVWTGSAQDKEPIDTALGTAAAWATQHGRPLYVGEFGAYSAAEFESRVRWTTYVVDSMAALGFSWGYWEFCAGFGVYDPEAQAFRPELLQALIH